MRYPHLMAPVRLGNLTLKNRMECTTSMPHTLQGQETFPGEPIIDHYICTAKNGAAIVSFATEFGYSDPHRPPMMEAFMGKPLDDNDPNNWRYYSQLVDSVHFYGSKISVVIAPLLPRGYGIHDRAAVDFSNAAEMSGLDGAPPFAGFGELREADTQMIRDAVETYARVVEKYCRMGFDLCTIHASYRGSLAAQLMSPLTNHRSDRYGSGSLEDRARFTVELCQRIKELCGKGFPVELQVSAEERSGGITLEDTIGFAGIFESCADILQLRAGNGEDAHPTGWNSRPGEHLTLRYAEAVKKSGTKLLVVPVGGFQDLEENERYIAEGKCDMIGMARAFICDSEYGKKALEGRNEDVVPCLLCNRCHSAPTGSRMELIPMCSVNPEIGRHYRLDRLITPPERVKRVAVAGGGPAGMKAALELVKRGHHVELFEAGDKLGGQLAHADVVSFKWPLARFKNYLIEQVEKSGVTVHMNTWATAETLQGRFDVIIAALGAVPQKPDIPGKDLPNVWTPHAVYGHEDELGHKVVVIGGASTGTETAVHLAELGHEVVVLTRREILAHDGQVVHFYDTMEDYWKSLSNFSFLPRTSAKAIANDGVVYTDSKGVEHSIAADSVVLCGGVAPLREEAFALAQAADEFYIIGDCDNPGSVHECMQTAHAAASVI